MKNLYLVLAAIGAVVPYAFFLPFFASHGLGLGTFLGGVFANGAAGGFGADLFVSSFAFWAFLFPEARRVGVARPWLYVAANLLVGLSLALPAFLYVRERARAGGAPPA